MKKYNSILTHGLFWLYFFSTRWILIDKNYFESSAYPFTYLIKLLSTYGLYSVLFYLMYFIFLPKLLLVKRVLLFVISTFLLGLFVFHTESSIWSGLELDKFLYPEFDNPMHQLYDILQVVFFALALFLWDKWNNLDKRRKLLENEVKESELKFLKSQLSPHFLFNTLNTIYGLSIYNSPNTPNAIQELKNVLNYIEEYNSKNGVLLGTEIENLKSYAAINNLRFQNNVNFNISVDNPDLKIEPMLFLPFLENAFKHGNNKKNSDVFIELEQKKDDLTFKIVNEFSDIKRKDNVSGVGIENVEKRLQILYPYSKISIKKSEVYFTVFIHLKGLYR